MPEGVAGGECALRRRDVHELGAAGHVARGPDPRVAAVLVGVDDDGAAVVGAYPDRRQIQSGGVGAAAGGDEQLGGPQFGGGPVGGADGDEFLAALGQCLVEGGAGEHGDGFVGEHLRDGPGDLGFLERRQPIQGLDHRDPGAEPGEQLCLFETDGVAAHHDQRPRQDVELHRGGRGQIPRLGEPVGRRRPRRGAGRDQVLIGVDHPRAIGPLLDPQHRCVGGTGEDGGSRDDLPAVVGGQVEVLLAAKPVDQRVLARDQLGEVHRCPGRRQPREPVGARRGVPGLRGGQQRLRRHAAHVHAGAADRGALDHHHPFAEVDRGDGGGERRRTGTDDRQIGARGCRGHGGFSLLGDSGHGTGCYSR